MLNKPLFATSNIFGFIKHFILTKSRLQEKIGFMDLRKKTKRSVVQPVAVKYLQIPLKKSFKCGAN